MIIVVPRQRVLATVAPLQPLGEERHRGAEGEHHRKPREPRLRPLAGGTGIVRAREATLTQT